MARAFRRMERDRAICRVSRFYNSSVTFTGRSVIVICHSPRPDKQIDEHARSETTRGDGKARTITKTRVRAAFASLSSRGNAGNLPLRHALKFAHRINVESTSMARPNSPRVSRFDYRPHPPFPRRPVYFYLPGVIFITNSYPSFHLLYAEISSQKGGRFNRSTSRAQYA